jgi:hypothetical protein
MSFDIVNYSATARRVADDDVDYSAFQRTPLPEAALRAVQYMSDAPSASIGSAASGWPRGAVTGCRRSTRQWQPIWWVTTSSLCT